MNKVIASLHALSARTLFPRALKWLTAGVYAWYLFNALLTYSTSSYLWGEERVLLRFGAADGMISNFIYSLMYDKDHFVMTYGLNIVGAFLGMFDKKWSWFPRLVAWITGLMLFYACIPAFNSASLIISLLAFITIPVYTSSTHPMRIVLNNTAYLAALLQVIAVYLFSSIYKLSGHMWIDGTAIYYALNIDRFSSSWIDSSGILTQMWLMKTLNYLVLGYQLLFPLLIWIKRIRKPLFLIGITMHLFIGWAMHLWDFAVAMLVVYLLFLPNRGGNATTAQR